MRANHSIGEATAEYGEAEYLVRPSFSALASIGNPSDIDTVVRGCLSAIHNLEKDITPSISQLSACAVMLGACSTFPSQWLGHWRESTLVGGKRVWVQGLVNINDLIVMANHCVKWGVMGDPRRTPSAKAKAEMSGLFDPQEFVAIAMMPHDAGGLGQTRTEAWSLTMTEFQRACEARMKAIRGGRPEPITPEEAEQLFKQVRERSKDAVRTEVAKPKPMIGRS